MPSEDAAADKYRKTKKMRFVCNTAGKSIRKESKRTKKQKKQKRYRPYDNLFLDCEPIVLYNKLQCDRADGYFRRMPVFVLRIYVPPAFSVRFIRLTAQQSYFRPWRSWITQQIPILKIGGSNPFGRAIKETSFVYQGKRRFFLLFTAKYRQNRIK